MNFSLARTSLIAEADLVGIAGESAVCDPRGVLYFPELRLLAVSDLHLEKGSSLARRGAIVISLGDSFHDGGGAERMHSSFRERLEALMAGRDWFWVAGNHDPEAPADLPGETVRELAIGSLLFRHEPSKLRVEGEISGHLHPCARIVQQGRSVRRRCFAGDGGRMIMPAFGAYTGSLNVLDRAYAGLFRLDSLMAYMLGSDRIFAISRSMLRPG
jgi:uncharacterized protein